MANLVHRGPIIFARVYPSNSPGAPGWSSESRRGGWNSSGRTQTLRVVRALPVRTLTSLRSAPACLRTREGRDLPWFTSSHPLKSRRKIRMCPPLRKGNPGLAACPVDPLTQRLEGPGTGRSGAGWMPGRTHFRPGPSHSTAVGGSQGPAAAFFAARPASKGHNAPKRSLNRSRAENRPPAAHPRVLPAPRPSRPCARPAARPGLPP